MSDTELLLSMLPVGFVLLWPWLRLLVGEINVVEAFFDWYYPWAVTGAIWTVMTQVSHVQEDCQRPPSGDDPDDYFRWQIESALDYSVGSELVPKLTASLSLQSMHRQHCLSASIVLGAPEHGSTSLPPWAGTVGSG